MNTLKEKLDNPKLIKSLAEHILTKFGKSAYYFSKDRDLYYCDSTYFFQDFPNKHIYLFGRLTLTFRENEKNLYEIFKNKNNKSIIEILDSYYIDFQKMDKNFSFLKIVWDQEPLIPNLFNLRKLESKDFEEKGLKGMDHVFIYDLGNVQSFKKGDWQEYLAKIYLSTLGEIDYSKFENHESDFLL